jgi:AbiV family abortive infection protein
MAQSKDTSVSPATLGAIVQNATDLLDDAETLHAHSRWPRCVSLSILAIEEAGKYLVLAPDSHAHRADPRYARRHAGKQMAVSRIFAASAVLAELRPRLELHGMDFVSAIDRAIAEPTPEDGSLAKEMLDVVTEAIRSEMRRHSSGTLEREKHRGLYVDVSGIGQMTSTPGEIGIRDANEWLRRATLAVRQVRWLYERSSGTSAAAQPAVAVGRGPRSRSEPPS